MSILRRGLHYLTWPLQSIQLPEYKLLYAARAISYCVGTIGIYYLTYKIGELVRSRLLGTIALCITISSATFFTHSIEYRTDQVCTFLFLLAIYALLRNPQRPLTSLTIALTLALSVFVNPKALYHGCVIGVACLYFAFYSQERTRALMGYLTTGLLAVLLCIALHALHLAHYNIPVPHLVADIESSASVGFGDVHGQDFKWRFLTVVAAGSLSLFPLTAIGILRGVALAAKGRINLLSLLMMCALLELLTIFLHQGVYAYYSINIIPLLSLTAAYPIWRLVIYARLCGLKRIKGVRTRLPAQIIFVVIFTCLLGILIRLPFFLTNSPEQQRLHISFLNSLFPEDINYADGTGILSRRKNVVHLFSNKRLLKYEQQRRPYFARLFEREFPGFLIQSKQLPIEEFILEDRKFVADNYVSYLGGKLRVHGKQISSSKLSAGTDFNARISHWYHWSPGDVSLIINGTLQKSPVFLEEGRVTIQCVETCSTTTIALGRHSPSAASMDVPLPANARGEMLISTPGRYFLWPPPQKMQGVPDIHINERPVTIHFPYSVTPSVYLSRGAHSFNSRSHRDFSLQKLGPLFLPTRVNEDYWSRFNLPFLDGIPPHQRFIVRPEPVSKNHKSGKPGENERSQASKPREKLQPQ